MTTKERKPIDWQHDYSTIKGQKYLKDSRNPDGTDRGCFGYIATEYGFVTVSYTIWTDESRLTLGIILNGTYYGRHHKGPVSRRYIVTLANRFAAEMAEGTQNR